MIQNLKFEKILDLFTILSAEVTKKMSGESGSDFIGFQ